MLAERGERHLGECGRPGLDPDVRPVRPNSEERPAEETRRQAEDERHDQHDPERRPGSAPSVSGDYGDDWRGRHDFTLENMAVVFKPDPSSFGRQT
jgi:hypothetical protein